MIGKEKKFVSILSRQPHAIAIIKGSEKYPDVIGVVKFYQTDSGVLVETEVDGLPYEMGNCKQRVFGFHIHEGTECTGNEMDMFAGAMAHYNPQKCQHPQHAGDMPPLFGNQEYAFSVFLTDRFSVEEVLGRTVIIHGSPDDFVTQPSGNSGEKIACGVIIQ